ncbi:MAG: endopeptidase La [Ruminococcaceae bacterium]|nr:endopeptidase La [Oscillospiraceae bacterium]
MEYNQLPTMAMRGIVVFPYMITHFDVGREKSVKALEAAMANDQTIFLVAQKDVEIDFPVEEDLYKVGTIAKIKQVVKLPGDSVRILVEGICRARIDTVVSEEPYFISCIEEIKDEIEDQIIADALLRQLRATFEQYFSFNNKINSESMMSIMAIDDISKITDVITSNISLRYTDKQIILETDGVFDRVTRLIAILKNEIEIIRLEQNISEKVKSQIDKNQREYYLREQLKVISDELGDKEGINGEIAEYNKKIEKAQLTGDIKEKLTKELQRLLKQPSGSPDAAVIRNYLDSVLEMPWNVSTKERFDIKKAERILNEEHYGLDKVKERVLEYLSVRKLAKNVPSPILCFVGPPGVGKTSIAKSIAEALNRNYVRISLGGVRDESDIRGHRKTYIGSMPGRIMNAMKLAKSNNPLMLLDEIDKMGNDFRGDPSAAMLEVLDAEQNFAFRDHYLEVPFDLSKVMFVTTANTLDTIPSALLDRMEVIEIGGYTTEEKLNIAKKHIIPKQMKKHGLKASQLLIEDDAIIDIIEYYTREAGVRNMERTIAKICRKSAKVIVSSKQKSIIITVDNLEKYLGKKKFLYDKVEKENEIGIVRGLAWTSVGGDTLSIEVNTMPGTGKIELTGQLGDIMKESARTALSYVRSRANLLGIEPAFYQCIDLHIHVPEGAVPKDGPSAGITMACAIVSALSGRSALSDVAMTGEITLRGRVLPIGGLKEKALAAYRAGVKKVIIPEENRRDLDEISDTIKNAINFIAVKNIDEVLEIALSKNKKRGFKLDMATVGHMMQAQISSEISSIKQ